VSTLARILKPAWQRFQTGLLSIVLLTNESPVPMQPRRPHRVEIFSSGPPSRSHTDVAV
jgi:hypothetical protein